MSQPDISAAVEVISTLEEVAAAVQEPTPAKRTEFRAWFHSLAAGNWDQQMEGDITEDNLDRLANAAISDSQACRHSSFNLIGIN